MTHPTSEQRPTPGEHGHFTTADRDACPVCNPSSNQMTCRFCDLPIATGQQRSIAIGGYGHEYEAWCIRALVDERARLTRINATLQAAEVTRAVEAVEADETIKRLTRELEVQKGVVDLAYIPHRSLVEQRDRADHEFKNFHRLLCERFDYGHDEKDWRRDQLSLIEWVAKRYSRDETSAPQAKLDRVSALLAMLNDPRQWIQNQWTKRIAAELRYILESPEEPPPERRETGWLVEDGAGHARPRFRTMDQTGIHWTDDANKALRFARRADAEMFAAGDEDAWRVTQHQWVTVDGDFIHAENGSEATKVTK